MIRDAFDPVVMQYFEEIKLATGLPSQTEVALAERIQRGDEEALEHLVKANLRFVVMVAKDYRDRGLPFADLIGAGNMGLLTAARRFDGTKGFKFISFNSSFSLLFFPSNLIFFFSKLALFFSATFLCAKRQTANSR